MNWMSNLFVVLLLTTITGTIFYLMGIPFRKLWFKRDIRLIRFQMRVTQLAFMVPFVYIVLYLHARMYLPEIKSRISLFYHTPATLKACIVLGCLWVGSFLILLASKLYRYYDWMRVCRGNIPEEDWKIEAVFTKICEQLGVSGKVSLSRNDMIDMPCIAYYHGFTVVLPLECYTEKEAAIIFYHELCHYLNGDIYLKTASCVATLLHVFNPAVRIVMNELSLVCEEYCDWMACLKGAEVFTEKEYYEMILGEVAEGKKRERYNLFMLADTIKDYERRVRCMREYHVHGGIKRGAAVLLAACFLLGSSITALAAGEGVTGAYGAVADATDVRNEENVAVAALSDEEVLEEFARAYDLNPEDVVIMGEEGIETIGDTIVINWPGIPAGKTYMYPGMHQSAGDSVYVSTVGTPSNITYQMGLKDPQQIMRYVQGSGSFSHNFAITIDGTFYFFVTNMSSSTTLDIKATVIR